MRGNLSSLEISHFTLNFLTVIYPIYFFFFYFIFFKMSGPLFVFFPYFVFCFSYFAVKMCISLMVALLVSIALNLLSTVLCQSVAWNMCYSVNDARPSMQAQYQVKVARPNFVLDDVMCEGKETHLQDCSHRPFFQHNCGSNEMASVTCIPDNQLQCTNCFCTMHERVDTWIIGWMDVWMNVLLEIKSFMDELVDIRLMHRWIINGMFRELTWLSN